MSSRDVNKAHFVDAPAVSIPLSVLLKPEKDDADDLWFVSSHPKKPGMCDLRNFRTGQSVRAGGSSWTGPYTGRPNLIAQLFPALREIGGAYTASSLRNVDAALRTWWRLFDAIEQGGTNGATPLAVHGVEDLTDVHWRVALDSGIPSHHFSTFLRAANLTRQAMGLKPLYWVGPDRGGGPSHLPQFEHVKALRDQLKREWYAVLDRWALADDLVVRAPQDDAEVELARYVAKLSGVIAQSGKKWPSRAELRLAGEYTTSGLLRCAYPDRFDVRTAFHLCLVGSGWNPSTLLDIDIASDFLRPNPKDPTRYVMSSYKERSKSDQITEGMYKTQRSPGAIILALINRTAPLREQLAKDYESRLEQFKEDRRKLSNREELERRKLELKNMQRGLRSPWLFADDDGGIMWLTETNWGAERGQSYMTALVARTNSTRPKKKQIPHLKAGDFRDAYAAYVYEVTGGAVFAVMQALGHKHPSSTQIYLHKHQLLEQSNRIYLNFSNEMWKELERSRRIDPTVLAAVMRFRTITRRERERLALYRQLTTSRIGVGCLSPTAPPSRVAPGFVPDGRKICPSQRCTLCFEKAVITAESLDGLAMRWCELYWARENIPPAVFISTSFAEEFANTESALMGFDRRKVEVHLAKWQARIENGLHKPLLFEYMQGVTQ